MNDIRLTESGDLYIDDNDVSATNSIRQAVAIQLRWFFNESPFFPEDGVKYFEKMFVKNPNRTQINSMITKEILKVDGVMSVKSVSYEVDYKARRATLKYEIQTTEDVIKEEVELWTTE